MSTPRRRDGEGTLPKQRADGRWFSDIRSTDDYGVTKRTRVYGASTARPVFDMDGSGTQCSYCGAIWPLCGHHHLSTMPTDDDERTTHE